MNVTDSNGQRLRPEDRVTHDLSGQDATVLDTRDGKVLIRFTNNERMCIPGRFVTKRKSHDPR